MSDLKIRLVKENSQLFLYLKALETKRELKNISGAGGGGGKKRKTADSLTLPHFSSRSIIEIEIYSHFRMTISLFKNFLRNK